MHISRRNRSRLITAAVGVTLFLNPGQATADDTSQSGPSASQTDSSGDSGDSSSSDSSGGADSSGDGSSGGGGSSSTSGEGSSDGDSSSGGSNSDGSSSGGGDSDDGDSGSSDTTSGGTGTGSTDANTSADDTTTTGSEASADTTTSTDDGHPDPDGVDTGTTDPGTSGSGTGYSGTSPDTGEHTGSPEVSSDDTSTPPPASAFTTSGDTGTQETGGTVGAEPTDADDDASPIGSGDSAGTRPNDGTESSENSPIAMRFAPSTPLDDTDTDGGPQAFSLASFVAPTTTTTPPIATTDGVVATFLSLLGLPLLGNNSAPNAVTTPAPWTLLWWIQRNQSLLTNQTPTATAILDPTDNGYTISLSTDDADSDPLTTALVSNPTSGNVVKNTDGTYTYTRTVGTAASDHFTLKVSDSGPHVHGLATLISLFNGQDPHSTYVTVTIPEAPATITTGTDGQVTGQIINHQPGTNYSVQGGTQTGTSTYTTDSGGTVAFGSNGTFTFTPDPADQFWAGGGGPTTQLITIEADDGTNPVQTIAVIVPITPINHVTIDTTGLNTTGSQRYSYGISDGAGSPVLTLLDHTTAQTTTITLPSGHNAGSTVTFSSDNGYAHVTDTTGSNVSIVDLTIGQTVGAYAITDNGGGTKTLTWTNGAPQAFSMRGMAPADADEPQFNSVGFTTNSFDTSDITGVDFRVTTEGTQAIIIAQQADDTYDIYLGNTTTGGHTLVSAGTPADPGSQFPSASFIPGTTIAIVQNGPSVTTISTAQATILNESQTTIDINLDESVKWQLTADNQFAYVERYNSSRGNLTGVTVVNLGNGTVTTIDTRDGGAVDTARSVLYTIESVYENAEDGTRVTRYDFTDLSHPTSVVLNGQGEHSGRGNLFGAYPFDSQGNFYIATITYNATAMTVGPGPVFENLTMRVLNSDLNEIRPIPIAFIDTIVTSTTILDDTIYVAADHYYFNDGPQGMNSALYRLETNGTTTFLANGWGYVADDDQHIFVVDRLPLDTDSEGATVLVIDNATGLVTPAVSFPSGWSLGDTQLLDGRHLSQTVYDGTNTIVYLIDIDGNITTTTVPAGASIDEIRYTNGQLIVTSTTHTTTQTDLTRPTTPGAGNGGAPGNGNGTGGNTDPSNSDLERLFESTVANLSIVPGHPGLLVSAISLGINLGQFAIAIGEGNWDDVVDEVGDIGSDIIGIFPVARPFKEPVRSLVETTVKTVGAAVYNFGRSLFFR